MNDDREWLEAMWNQHAGKIYAYAARRVGRDAADDVVADTFVVAWRNRGSRPSRELPWLYGVARRVIGDRRRSGDRFQGLVDRLTTGSGSLHNPDPDARLAARAALDALSEDDREVLLLAAWEGLDAGDAARALGVSSPSYRMRLSRARRRLAKAMAAQSGEETP
ncbi:MAG: RNA polymerase sigma factor [Acidimicrobiia bacterium]